MIFLYILPKSSDMPDQKRMIAHIDMDCFFCACEMKRNPDLKGQPVIVGGTGYRGVVSTASYEAREYGVYSATPIAIARRKCPNGVYLPTDGRLYREESEKVMEIISQFSDTIRQVSVDEAYLDVTELSKSFEDLKSMAEMIQKTIRDETELTCSIGIARSTIVAKIASDFRKPAGITIVEDTRDFLKDMDISKIPGIGKTSEEMYKDMNIYKIGDFLEKTKSELFEKFGRQGIFYRRLAEGDFYNSIELNGPRKSVSREDTLDEDTSDIIRLEDEIDKLCEEVYDDLDGGFFRTVSIKIRYSDFTTITRDKGLKTISNDLDMIKKEALSLFRKTINSKDDVRLLGVKLGKVEEKGQKTLSDLDE